ncbi:hypothetical protein Sjap_014844 [Stephania japonica]|uniref:Uncharacterized protein n=1 Tax=Stephania japonica TaxID=461633 RepID=A0AAP0NQB6_9MAGN
MHLDSEGSREELPDTRLRVGAIVFALKIWRHHLYGVRFELFMRPQELEVLIHSERSEPETKTLAESS